MIISSHDRDIWTELVSINPSHDTDYVSDVKSEGGEGG